MHAFETKETNISNKCNIVLNSNCQRASTSWLFSMYGFELGTTNPATGRVEAMKSGPKPLGHSVSTVHHYTLLATHVYMSHSEATISNKLNLQGLQSCQPMECCIWYNVDQVIVKIPVKKLYYIDM